MKPKTWCKIKFLTKNAILLVACDKEYEFNDYIESYQEFLKIIKKEINHETTYNRCLWAHWIFLVSQIYKIKKIKDVILIDNFNAHRYHTIFNLNKKKKIYFS